MNIYGCSFGVTNRYERPSSKRRRKNREEFIEYGFVNHPIGLVWGKRGWFVGLYAKTLAKQLNELVFCGASNGSW